MSDQTWYSVGPNDVFPEQFATLAFPVERDRRLFLLYHQDLIESDFWLGLRQRIERGYLADVFPYPEHLRFSRRFAASAA